jgi:hypothetical protein
MDYYNDWQMLNYESCRRKYQWPILRSYPNIYLKLQREITKDLSCLSYGNTSKPGISQLQEHNAN